MKDDIMKNVAIEFLQENADEWCDGDVEQIIEEFGHIMRLTIDKTIAGVISDLLRKGDILAKLKKLEANKYV